MPSLTVENYLKTVLLIEMKTGSEWISTGALAEAMTVAPGTVTSMMKTLSESGLIEYRPYSGAKLTDAGRTLGMRMLRRHRLIELFLAETLNLTWDQVHEEAENMEHAISDFVIDRIDEFLGHPATDPHGAPIPNAEGHLRGNSVSTQTLSECSVGLHVRITRVASQEPEFLRYLTESGMELGTELTIEKYNADAGVMSVLTSGQSVTLALTAAATILVEVEV